MRYRITNKDEYDMVSDFIFHILTIGDAINIDSLNVLLTHLTDLIEGYENEYYII